MKPQLQQSVKLANITPWGNYANRPPDAEFDSSIKEKGVQQPVILRYTKKEGVFELIAGKRRFESSKKADRKEIPSIISEMTDEEAAEIQLIENLQRTDVHPMQEARAFKTILMAGKKTIEVIAAHVSKSTTYVAQRLKLNDIIPEFQEAFEQNRVDLSDMLRVFQLTTDTQKQLWNDRFINAPKDRELNLDDHVLNRYRGLLHDAPFNIEDDLLDSKMGACVTCQNNTAANTVLFPLDEVKATCGLISCFANKCKLSYENRLKESLANPAIVLVDQTYGRSDEAEALMKKEKCNVLNNYNFNIIEKPQIPKKPDFVPFDPEEEYDYKDKKSWEKFNKEINSEYESELVAYKKDLDDYTKKVTAGKFVRAFVIAGQNRGKFIFVAIEKTNSNGTIKKTSANALKDKAKEDVTKEDIGSEINRIKERVKRSREIDEEKIGPEIYDAMNKCSEFKNNSKPLSKDEKIAMIIALTRGSGSSISSYNKLKSSKAVDAELALAMRKHMIENLSEGQFSNREKKSATAILEDIALVYISEKAKKIRADQMLERAKREENADKKLESLKAKIKEMPSKVEKKKPATKKIAKKK